jgi:hypothetical protein
MTARVRTTSLKEDRDCHCVRIRWARPFPRTGCALLRRSDCDAFSGTCQERAIHGKRRSSTGMPARLQSVFQRSSYGSSRKMTSSSRRLGHGQSNRRNRLFQRDGRLLDGDRAVTAIGPDERHNGDLLETLPDDLEPERAFLIGDGACQRGKRSIRRPSCREHHFHTGKRHFSRVDHDSCEGNGFWRLSQQCRGKNGGKQRQHVAAPPRSLCCRFDSGAAVRLSN